jgi:hypothetical protein
MIKESSGGILQGWGWIYTGHWEGTEHWLHR